ncbi:hypothetical protein BD309DRAFT_949164 [Dichomitus squalens]|uniref:Uncharacterized protein n=1 Tax=Dichomitus squalens TaxID=114155 RepID=A0A4V2K5K1_9APHY|nr:hypothetical protein BD309DRAFT_949164 [Dichomitus squalens]TBU59681.1 hypothetical protein BD310DRAFT_924414 [Dichomitus squalens]
MAAWWEASECPRLTSQPSPPPVLAWDFETIEDSHADPLPVGRRPLCLIRLSPCPDVDVRRNLPPPFGCPAALYFHVRAQGAFGL